MNYLKAYFEAFLGLFKIASMIFFSLSLLSDRADGSIFFLYLIVTVSVAGPIKLAMERGNSLG